MIWRSVLYENWNAALKKGVLLLRTCFHLLLEYVGDLFFNILGLTGYVFFFILFIFPLLCHCAKMDVLINRSRKFFPSSHVRWHRPVAVDGEEKCCTQSLLQFLESRLWVIKSWVFFLFLFSASFLNIWLCVSDFSQSKVTYMQMDCIRSSLMSNAWVTWPTLSHWPLATKALTKTLLRSILSLLSLDFVLYGSFVFILLSISQTSTCFSEQHPRIYSMDLCQWFLDFILSDLT